MKKILLFALLIIFVLFPNSNVFAQLSSGDVNLPDGFFMETVIDGIPSAGVAAFAPNGMVFLAGKHGIVLTYENGQLNPNPFIDISQEVNSFWDRGLLGIAIHPQFPEKPFVYLLYTYDPPGFELDGNGSRVSRLIRINADPDDLSKSISSSMVIILGKNSTLENVGDEKNSKTVEKPACFDQIKKIYIEDCIPSDSPSHSIGTVMFGLDNSLYIGTGEGSHYKFVDQRAARAQDLNALSGKILRINPDNGDGLPDNPFYMGDPKDNQSRIWDYGLRNPFRFTQNPNTGDLMIGDVGWNQWEEINSGKGKNFGWPCFEGANNKNLPQPAYESNPGFVNLCQPIYSSGGKTVTPPIFSYPNEDGAAVVVGPVYDGNSYPEEYHGNLFFGDFDRRIIRYLHKEPDGGYESHEFASNLIESGGPVQLLTGINGDLYSVIYDKDTASSKLVRFVHDPGGKKHGHISISASPVEGKLPLITQFRITSSSFEDTKEPIFEWDFGDGTKGVGSNIVHSYAKQGVFKTRVGVRNTPNDVFSNEITIHAGNSSPIPVILSPSTEYRYHIGDRIELIGESSDPEDGTILSSKMKWDVLIHHKGHVHSDIFHADGKKAGFLVPDHGDQTWLEVCLTVEDSQKLEKKICKSLLPKTSSVNFASDPPGLGIVYEGESKTTPVKETPVINSTMEISTLQSQFCMKFDHWSDSGPRSHSISIADKDISLTAFYKGTLPSNWLNGEIGSNTDGDGCLQSSDTLLWPSSRGLYYSTDSLNFIYRSMSDDFSYKIEIPFEYNEQLAPELSGFLVRASLLPDSPSLFFGWDAKQNQQIFLRNSNSLKFQKATIKSLPLLPWQKIVRIDEKITWFQSSDGIKWEQVVIVSFPSPEPILVGLTVFDPAGESFGPVRFINPQVISGHP